MILLDLPTILPDLFCLFRRFFLSWQLRDSIDCVYSWAHNYAEVREDSRAGCFMAIWEAVTAMVHLLNVPLEVGCGLEDFCLQVTLFTIYFFSK